MGSKRPDNFNSRLDRGIEGIKVTPWHDLDAQAEADRVASFFVSTWGEAKHEWPVPEHAWQTAQMVARGEGLPNALESVSLTYSIEGVSRATTHQLVRTRVGAGFGQQGGRDNDWSNYNFRMPESFNQLEGQQRTAILKALHFLDEMYTEATQSGVPYQDARYILPMGLETHLVGTYNLLSLMGTLKRRLCNRMMWETNYVARLMADDAVRQLPWLGRNLQASCRRGICQSVSPMFPPADLVPFSGSSDARYADDNPTLQKMLRDHDEGYDWDRDSNGCFLHFDEIDRLRIENEYMNRDAVYSLVDGVTQIAQRDADGNWRSM